MELTEEVFCAREAERILEQPVTVGRLTIALLSFKHRVEMAAISALD